MTHNDQAEHDRIFNSAKEVAAFTWRDWEQLSGDEAESLLAPYGAVFGHLQRRAFISVHQATSSLKTAIKRIKAALHLRIEED